MRGGDPMRVETRELQTYRVTNSIWGNRQEQQNAQHQQEELAEIRQLMLSEQRISHVRDQEREAQLLRQAQSMLEKQSEDFRQVAQRYEIAASEQTTAAVQRERAVQQEAQQRQLAEYRRSLS